MIENMTWRKRITRSIPILISLTLILDGLLTVGLSVLSVVGSKIGYNISHLDKELNVGYQFHVIWFQLLICYVFFLLAKGIYHRKRVAWAISIVAVILLGLSDYYVYGINWMLSYHLSIIATLLIFYKLFDVPSNGFQMTFYQWVVLISFILTVLYGVVGSYLMRSDFSGIENWADALYFTVATYSTVGSPIEPVSVHARYFTISMIVIGLGVFATALTVIILPMMESRIKHVLNIMQQGKNLNHHTIICGYNPISRVLIKRLIKAKEPYIVVTRKELSLAENINTIHGKIYDDLILKAIRIKTAKRIISLYDNDSENILSCITAKAIADKNKHELEIILRIDNLDNEEKAIDLGANKIISPATMVADSVDAGIE